MKNDSFMSVCHIKRSNGTCCGGHYGLLRNNSVPEVVSYVVVVSYCSMISLSKQHR